MVFSKALGTSEGAWLLSGIDISGCLPYSLRLKMIPNIQDHSRSIRQFRCHPDIASANARLLDPILDAFAHSYLIAVGRCAVNVSVASLDGGGDDLGDVRLVKVPCSETKKGD